MKNALVLLVALAASTRLSADDGPGEAALEFLRGLTEENGVFAVEGTAVSPDIPEARRADIAQRLSRLGRQIRPGDLRLLDQKLDGDLAGVLVSQITDFDSSSVQVHAVGLVKGGDKWLPAPLPSSFDSTGLSLRPGFLPRVKDLENWMLRSRSEQLVRLKDDSFSLLFEEMRKLRSPDELHEAAPEKLAADFLAALRARSLPGALALLGGLEARRPSEWEDTFQVLARLMRSPVIKHPGWRLLAAPEAARAVVLTEQDGEDGMVSIVALDPSANLFQRPEARAIHLPFVRSKAGMWRIRLPQELLMTAAAAQEQQDEADEEEQNLDAEIIAAFPAKLRETAAAAPEASPHAAVKALFEALRGATLQDLVPRIALDADPALALDGLTRAARLWQRLHRPEQIAGPVLLEIHESGDDACALVQVFSASTPEKAELEEVYFQRDDSGWLVNPGFSGDSALGAVKEGKEFKEWAGQQRPAREKDWSAGLTMRLGGIAADSAPAEDEARRVVEAWREAILKRDAASMFEQSACFDDDAGLSRLLRNSGYEMLGRQKGDILGVHRAGRWAAVSLRVPAAPGDDSADAYPLYVIAATPGGPRVLPELDLFDPLTRGREFLNRKVWERLAARLPDGASGELESIYEKHRTISAADREARPKTAE
jgi:hypothetical protein